MSRRLRPSLRASLIVSALALAGCPKPAVRPYPPPTAEQLLATLRARQDHLKTLRADAKVDYFEKAGKRARIRVHMLLGRGGKLRFEADSPFGGSLSTLTSDGKNFALLDVRANRFFVGPANACNVARMIRLSIAPDDVVAVLMGGAPLDGTIKGSSWDPNNGGREVLTLALPDGGEERIELDARDKTWDVMRAERHDGQGHLLWRVTNSDFKDVGGFRLPETEDVVEPPHGGDAEIKFRSLEPNVDIPDDLFRLPPPEGLTPEPAEC